MNTVRFSVVALVALSFSALGLGGCAADSGEEEGTETPVLAKTEETSAAPTVYHARVMRSDIVAGGGSCVGNLCTINGQMWDCNGPGYCVVIKN